MYFNKIKKIERYMMELEFKPDFSQVQERMEAWWQDEVLDRIPVKVTAPKKEKKGSEGWILSSAFPLSTSDGKLFEIENKKKILDLEDYFTDPEVVIPRIEGLIEKTYWGGEAFPVMFPVAVNMVALTAVLLGSSIKYIDTNTTWIGPNIKNWKKRKTFEFDPDNSFWKKCKILLEKASERGFGKYIIGIPDLNGPGEILSLLRGHTELCFDIIENPYEIFMAMREINDAWLRYWEACHGIVHQYMGGYTNMFSVWSKHPLTDLQCDFSCLISPEDFNRFFLPYIAEQTEWIDRTVYHLDGPGSLKHLDSLLSLPKLDGIQWIPGAGSARMSDWIELLQKIQNSGKKLIIICEKFEVEKLVKELKSKGLLIETACGSIKEAEELLKNVKKWT